MIRAGDPLRILPDYMDTPCDNDYPRFAVEDEDGGRVLMVTDLGWRHNPTARVSSHMVEVLPWTWPLRRTRSPLPHLNAEG